MKTLKNSMVMISILRLLPFSANGDGILQNPVKVLTRLRRTSGLHDDFDITLPSLHPKSELLQSLGNRDSRNHKPLKNLHKQSLLLGIVCKSCASSFLNPPWIEANRGRVCLCFLGCSGKWGVNSSCLGDFDWKPV